MARKLEDFAQDEDKDDSEEAVMRRQQYRKVRVHGIVFTVLIAYFKESYESIFRLEWKP